MSYYSIIDTRVLCLIILKMNPSLTPAQTQKIAQLKNANEVHFTDIINHVVKTSENSLEKKIQRVPLKTHSLMMEDHLHLRPCVFLERQKISRNLNESG